MELFDELSKASEGNSDAQRCRNSSIRIGVVYDPDKVPQVKLGKSSILTWKPKKGGGSKSASRAPSRTTSSENLLAGTDINASAGDSTDFLDGATYPSGTGKYPDDMHDEGPRNKAGKLNLNSMEGGVGALPSSMPVSLTGSATGSADRNEGDEDDYVLSYQGRPSEGSASRSGSGEHPPAGSGSGSGSSSRDNNSNSIGSSNSSGAKVLPSLSATSSPRPRLQSSGAVFETRESTSLTNSPRGTLVPLGSPGITGSSSSSRVHALAAAQRPMPRATSLDALNQPQQHSPALSSGSSPASPALSTSSSRKSGGSKSLAAKPFKCRREGCNKSYSMAYELLMHENKVHTSAKNFVQDCRVRIPQEHCVGSDYSAVSLHESNKAQKRAGLGGNGNATGSGNGNGAAREGDMSSLFEGSAVAAQGEQDPHTPPPHSAAATSSPHNQHIKVSRSLSTTDGIHKIKSSESSVQAIIRRSSHAAEPSTMSSMLLPSPGPGSAGSKGPPSSASSISTASPSSTPNVVVNMFGRRSLVASPSISGRNSACASPAGSRAESPSRFARKSSPAPIPANESLGTAGGSGRTQS